MAEQEHRLISERTKAALAAAKARGVKLGGDPASLKNQALGWSRSAQVRRERAARRAADLQPVIEAVRGEGAASYAATAAGLNARGVPGGQGSQRCHSLASRVIQMEYPSQCPVSGTVQMASFVAYYRAAGAVGGSSRAPQGD